jgi:glutamyl-Q tRNA(Asp) synthetase
MQPVTRFAPAPTGYLHLGHLVNAIHVWGLARARGGRVLLRIEDHDRQRCRPEFVNALVEDLAWLGFEPDTAPEWQSDHMARYDSALAGLRGRGLHLYACTCSRKYLARHRGDFRDQETPYDGHCRERGLAMAPGCGLRLVMAPGEEAFTDLILGPQRQNPSLQCGDLLVKDRMGNWTYQFAVVVDDLADGVDLVIRGEDLLQSTGRQIRLSSLLGRPLPPRFAHHLLIRNTRGVKLSKANRDTSLRELRAAGHSAAELIGRAAAMVGLIPAPAPLSVEELPALFSNRLPFEVP